MQENPEKSTGAEKDVFLQRHLGLNETSLKDLLKTLNLASLDELVKQTLPEAIYKKEAFQACSPLTEKEVLAKASQLGAKNKVFKNYIGQGYIPCITPGVIQRNILENPSWYTSYTPYQSELAQGRLEALLNFQTFISELTGLELAGSSLLDEGTAAAEACFLAKSSKEDTGSQAKKFFVDKHTWPQTLDVMRTRAEGLGWQMEVGDFSEFKGSEEYFAAFLQYPNSQGDLASIQDFLKGMQQLDIVTIVASDPLSLFLFESPGKMGAQIMVGSTQRLGVPLFFGGPHAAYLATKTKYQSKLPGRIVGVSQDRRGQPALRLALQTREQHIRRERATSNICTSQVLLAIMTSFYVLYHGEKGLKKLAKKVHALTGKLRETLLKLEGGQLITKNFFDTLVWEHPKAAEIYKEFLKNKINVHYQAPNQLSWTIGEPTEEEDLEELTQILFKTCQKKTSTNTQTSKQASPAPLRKEACLTHPIFSRFHSETELLRYIHSLQSKELSLTHSMIPLGSCTMKLNSVTEMTPVTWESFASLHPFAPPDQVQGFTQLLAELEQQLCELTGFKAFSFQPNAGSQGEYAGLLTIKKYQHSKGQGNRNICFIPTSAHGTNPASAKLAGLKVVPIACTKEGNIDLEDLDKKLLTYRDSLSSMMITYPSTYGVFEEGIETICKKIHEAGALVYLDGANMNAMLGLCKPHAIGFDVCHLNLHKTFCIPHGGGGPGAGPIGVSEELRAFLPGHKFLGGTGACSSAPYGSAGILVIPWAYILLMGREGLKKSAEIAIANANYISKNLKPHYRILFTGRNDHVAHECIVDFRKFRNSADITIDDIAKRLIDYSFHAPTMSWPVPGTLMIEPTESESKEELDKFCQALINIRKELELAEKDPNYRSLFKNSPHTIEDIMQDKWPFPYTKEQAVYPLPWVKTRKFWSPVSRVNNSYGDINLFCSCPPVAES